jgi:PAS domain S-box-containing protein
MARKRQTIQFEQNDKLFKALIENSWDVIILIDSKGRAKYASPSIVRMFRRDYKEFIGIQGIKFVHPFDMPKVAKGLAQIIRNPQEPIHMEMRVRHKDGHYLWLEALATNFLSDKNINGIVVNLHDITELKKIDEQKDEFISIASHELKSPITSIKAYLQIMRNRGKTLDTEKTDEFLRKIYDQIQRLDRFVNDLYDATRIREGKISLMKERFKLLPLLQETADDTERNYGTHRILFDIHFNGTIIADKMRMQQVLINILVNAIKFSPNANKIKLKVWKEKNNIYISVKDYGFGIEKNTITKITERFYQAETINKAATGLGLGLYISYNIIKQHNGDFSVKSNLGKSTTVTFYIPQK